MALFYPSTWIKNVILLVLLFFIPGHTQAQKNRAVVLDATTLLEILEKDYSSIEDLELRLSTLQKDRSTVISIFKAYAYANLTVTRAVDFQKNLDDQNTIINKIKRTIQASTPSATDKDAEITRKENLSAFILLDLNEELLKKEELLFAVDTEELTKLADAFTSNKFLTNLIGQFLTKFESLSKQQYDQFAISTGSGQIQKSINLLGGGGLSLTQAADGLASFLAKRIKEELAIQVFDKISDLLSKNPPEPIIEELKIILPLTSNFLITITPQEYPGVITTLKEKIELDIKHLTHNLPNLRNATRFKELANKYPEVELVFLGMQFINDLEKVNSPMEIIFVLEESDMIQFWSRQGRFLDFVNAVKLGALMTYAITEQYGNTRTFIHPEEWNKYKSNQNFYNAFLGFVMAQNRKFYNVTFHGEELDSTLMGLARIEDFIDPLFPRVKDLLNQAKRLNDDITNLGQLRKDVGKNSPDSIARVLNSSVTFLDSTFSLVSLMAPMENEVQVSIKSKEKYYVSMARTMISLYADVGEKRYYNALQDAISLLTRIKGIKKFEIFSSILELEALLPDLKRAIVANEVCNNEMVARLANIGRNLKMYCNCSDFDSIVSIRGTVRQGTEDFDHINDLVIRIDNVIDGLITRSGLADVSNLPSHAKAEFYKQLKIELLNTESKLDENVLKILNLVVAVAKAKTADDFEKAIEAIVLPAGSAIVKRESVFNFSLNAYAGFFYGTEQIISTKAIVPAFAFTAPIGPAFSCGLGKAGSLTLFISIIDIGAFTSVRFEDSGAKLPEITFQNIFAPGGHLIWGIPKSPFSIALYGVQYGPALRKITYPNGTSAPVTEEQAAFRYGLSFLIDIPLLNFYTKSKSYK